MSGAIPGSGSFTVTIHPGATGGAPQQIQVGAASASTAATSPAPSAAAIGGISVDQLRALAQRRRRIRFENRPLQRVKAEVDPERGLVRFERPVGWIVDTQIRAARYAQVRYPPRVRLTIAYEDSPDARAAVQALGQGLDLPAPSRGAKESQYRYHYLAGRTENGKAQHLNPLTFEDDERVAKLFPQVVEDESFRLFVTLDGRSNRAALDARAAEIASRLIEGPADLPGEEGEAQGFHDIGTSSVIGRVRWELGPGIARTEWSVNNVGAAKATFAAKVAGEVAKVGFTTLRNGDDEDRIYIDRGSRRRRL